MPHEIGKTYRSKNTGHDWRVWHITPAGMLIVTKKDDPECYGRFYPNDLLEIPEEVYEITWTFNGLGRRCMTKNLNRAKNILASKRHLGGELYVYRKINEAFTVG